MADPRRALASNVPGELFVDKSCIDCDTCRQLAPKTVGDDGEHAFVQAQPTEPADVRAALRALIACPTGSIGTRGESTAADVRDDFPMHVTGNVSYLGYTSKDSFGASSYLIEHPAGNWMVDSPRYNRHLAQRIEQRGGVSIIFITHEDDVADSEAYAGHFDASRVIHFRDLLITAEIVKLDDEEVTVHPGFRIIPTPGHTRGHCCLLYEPPGGETILFSGDHLWWSRARQRLWASREVCWYDWEKQADSVERLLAHDIDWVLPGHGERRHLGREATRAQLRRLLADMRA